MFMLKSIFLFKVVEVRTEGADRDSSPHLEEYTLGSTGMEKESVESLPGTPRIEEEFRLSLGSEDSVKLVESSFTSTPEVDHSIYQGLVRTVCERLLFVYFLFLTDLVEIWKRV